MAYDVGGRGDQSFNDSAAAGLDKAKVEELGVEAKEAEASDGEAETASEERLRTFADAGYNPVIAVGFAYAASVGKVAEEFPDTQFAIIDDSSLADGPNVASLVFAEEQGSFLVGAAAALKSEDRPRRLRRRRRGPADQEVRGGLQGGRQGGQPGHQGRRQVPTQPPDFSGFNDPAKGKTAAEGMYDDGADIVYQAAGGSGGGVFEAAAKAAGKLGDRRRLRPVQHRRRRRSRTSS